jgi:AcrR family transcriptional regulator
MHERTLLIGTYRERRAAAAAQTRRAILQAAREEFETRGWAGSTIRSIAARAGVSQKTVERLFATKAALLEATLLAFLGGGRANTDTRGFVRREVVLDMFGEATRDMERAPDAATVLDVVAAAVCDAHSRASRMYAAVETAVPSDERLAQLWERLIESQLFAIRRWAEILLQKPGVRADLTLSKAEKMLLVTCDWNPYRTLITRGGMTPDDVKAWASEYHRRMLLA